ncbi:TetR/AcrR family transcriptional regulator C-terminal domain-containing protein [Staphylococcus lloydii]|uniref:TetR/AcrR family transcriptional regulator n=1 Tax=Staphylococcus lloydii TaxID=2781774 RepID=UPI0029289CFE|nr:TetR/AcrR family transcriptional regulator C-terminal domain-containing protein [Staphylococcus lloydii]MDU9418319.1 TetR/AcrR family transcriptional regulator C-terminal domain-containing protein [Staphylococcus lloydii]
MEDRRIKKSKHAIKQAFIQLLQEQELDKITIRDITTLADINRGTFYLHYVDKYDLLSSMEDDYLTNLTENLNFDYLLKKYDSTEAFAKEFTSNILKKYMSYIGNNIDFYKVILSLERKSQIESKISQLMFNNMRTHMTSEDQIAGIPLDYFHSYVSGATISFIKHWVQDDNRMSVDDLSDILFKIIFNGPLRLMANQKYDQY